MIIEFFGLSGTGKTAIARAVAQKKNIDYVNVDTLGQKFWYTLSFFVSSPCKSLRLLFLTIRESQRSWPLLRHKLFVFLCMVSRNQKARRARHDVVLDEGLAEYLIVLFAQNVGEKAIARYLQDFVVADTLVFLRTEESVRIKRMLAKPAVPRLGLEPDWYGWQAVQLANERLLEQVMVEQTRPKVITVDTTQKGVDQAADAILNKLS